MQQIFVDQKISVGEQITVTGEDARHLSQVLRMRPGEMLRVSVRDTAVSDGADEGAENSGAQPTSFLCKILSLDKEQVQLLATEEMASTELTNKIYLFQAIPKGDRMETVIEKAVELGVYEIIPVEMKYCVVKLDEKKKKTRVRRYQAIAESAAKQSKRSRIPTVSDVLSYQEALRRAKECEMQLVPYECKEGMQATKEALDAIRPGDSVAIFIGPEGGFAREEIDAAMEQGMHIISLGKRILRTDTAAITAVSMVMLASELQEDIDGSVF